MTDEVGMDAERVSLDTLGDGRLAGGAKYSAGAAVFFSHRNSLFSFGM